MLFNGNLFSNQIEVRILSELQQKNDGKEIAR